MIQRKDHLLLLQLIGAIQFIFREGLLREAIKFESWTLLEKQFRSQAVEQAQWRTARQFAALLVGARPLNKPLDQLKIWQLSMKFPMFNEDAVPGPVLKNWYLYSG